MGIQHRIANTSKKSVITNITYIFVLVVIFSSCVTSKKAVELTKSYDYQITQIHVEKRNSSYDNLIGDYYEKLKTTDQKYKEKFSRDTLAFMMKSACLGRCPVFRITLYNNGKVKFEGEANVELIGIYESKLEEEQEKKVKALLGEIEFLKLPRTFPRNVSIVSESAVTKMLLSDGTFKFPYTINYGEPQEITNIQLYLDQLIGELSWVQI